MKVTRKIIAEEFRVDLGCVTQIANKQLFIVHVQGKTLLVSYYTIVGYLNDGGVWVLTSCRYSITTTQQLRQFAKQHKATWQIEPIDSDITI